MFLHKTISHLRCLFKSEDINMFIREVFVNNKKLLGKRIKEIRKKQNLTQEQLAEIIAIETASLSAIESGRHFPSLPTIEKIAIALHTEIKTLFTFSHLQTADEMRQYIYENLPNVPNEKIPFLYKIFEFLKD